MALKTQVDLGLDKSWWGWFGWSDIRMVDKGISSLEIKKGFYVLEIPILLYLVELFWMNCKKWWIFYWWEGEVKRVMVLCVWGMIWYIITVNV